MSDDIVVCMCGCDTFRLRYGHYTLFATCTKCGVERVVYDG